MEDNKLYDRLDIAIERLTSVSHEIKQILVVHETKLDNQEELNRQYYDQIDKLHVRIGELRDELKVTRQFLNRLSQKGSSDNQGKML